MDKKIFRHIAVFSLVFAVGACGKLGTGSEFEPGPVGTGTSVKELKRSPCACVEIPMQFPDGFNPGFNSSTKGHRDYSSVSGTISSPVFLSSDFSSDFSFVIA